MILGKMLKGGIKVAGKQVHTVKDLTGARSIEVHSVKPEKNEKKPVNIVGGGQRKEGGPEILDKNKGV